MSTGRSPLDMVHCTVTESPKLAGTSPKSKGVIWGGTLKIKKGFLFKADHNEINNKLSLKLH